MSTYSRQIAMAIRLIAAKGQSVSWLIDASTISATQPWKHSVAADSTKAVKILFLRPGGGLTQSLNRLLSGTEVTEGGPRGLLAAGNLDFVPNEADKIVRNGVTMNIKSFNVVAPDGTPILYDIEFV